MECQDCSSQLSALMDDELSSLQTQEVEEHLDTCSSCSDEYESLRISYLLVDRLPEDALLPLPWEQINRHVLVPSRPRGGLWRDLFFPGSWVPLGAGAFSLLLCIALLIPSRVENLQLSQALEAYEEQREAEQAQFMRVGLVSEIDLPNPFTVPYRPAKNPFIME